MSTIQRATLSDQIFRELSHEILTGIYQPGDKLPTQRELATRFGVHANSAREALQRLMQVGLVDIRHGDAVRASDWLRNGSILVLAELVTNQSADHPEIFQSLMEARKAVVVDAARLAAERRSDKQLELLRQLSDRLNDKTLDIYALQAADFQFFSCLIESSGNIVYRLITNTMVECYEAQTEFFISVMKPIEKLRKHYRELVKMLEQQDGEGAAICAHKMASLQEQAVING